MQVLYTIHDCNTSEVLEYIKHDKKGEGNTVNFILPDKIGSVKKCAIHDKKMIEEILEVLKEEDWNISSEI